MTPAGSDEHDVASTVAEAGGRRVLTASAGGVHLAVDLRAQRTHHLNATAWSLLRAQGVEGGVEELVRYWASGAATPAEVRAGVARGLEGLEAAGLLGDDHLEPPRSVVGAGDPRVWPHHGAVHAVVGHGVQFHGPDRGLISRLDEALGTEVHRSPTVHLVVAPEVGGGVTLEAETTWWYVDEVALAQQIPLVLNEYAATSERVPALHAAAAVHPDVGPVLLPGASGAGKSTLVAALVQEGWVYLGDEATGVFPETLTPLGYPKPLALDRGSRAALGLEGEDDLVLPRALGRRAVSTASVSEPVAAVVAPRFEAGTGEPTAVRVPVDRAVDLLIANTMNLHRCGERGLDALLRLAVAVPVWSVVFAEVTAAARLVGELARPVAVSGAARVGRSDPR